MILGALLPSGTAQRDGEGEQRPAADKHRPATLMNHLRCDPD